MKGRDKIKEIIEIAKEGDKIPSFMCVMRNLAKAKEMYVVDLMSEVIEEKIKLTDKEIQEAGKACIEAGKFVTPEMSEQRIKELKEKPIFWTPVRRQLEK